MNILVLAAYGLYENYSASFVHNQIKEYVKQGHRVRAVVPVALGKKTAELSRISAPVVKAVHDGVEIFFVRCLSLSGRGEHGFNPMAAEKAVAASMDTILRDFAPDVIHSQAILMGGRLGVLFKKRCKVPFVITTHGGDTDISLTPGQIDRARKICDCADLIVAVSPAYVEKTKCIGSKTPVTCILNGFNTDFAVEREKKRHSIIHVGSFIKRKHADLTVRAAAMLRNEYPSLTLTLVGSGAGEEELKNLVRELNAEGYISFTGYLTNSEAMEKMAESEVFVLPSTEEGFGIVYLEAMASGCAAIGTAGEGIDGVIVDGENGYLVKPMDLQGLAEAIKKCFDDPEKTKALADRGRSLAKTLTWERNAAEYISVFNYLK